MKNLTTLEKVHDRVDELSQLFGVRACETQSRVFLIDTPVLT
jgi:hypothetical protein